ncbi:hypothetical protein ACQR0Z_18310 [Bradyrhizobium sp. HKCCYLS3077]|uniref:hypothetical protein n=1 Tax=Bradyrhizobium sp. HKCCYLS3077 TaxID=3420761 RepID=UPI003EB921E8
MADLVRRTDFANSLVHLTRERKELNKATFCQNIVATAFDVLKEILISGTVRGGLGFVKGSKPVVCLSEIPLASMDKFASQTAGGKERYRFYGVALSKQAVFGAGGRPVIYLPDNEASWIPSEQKWRQVKFEPPHVDWTHEREWRVPGDLDLTKVPGIYVIVWGAHEAREILNLKCPVETLIRGALPMEHLNMML